MSDELRRAFDFLARADMAGERAEPCRFGVAVYDDRVPTRYDSNHLLADAVPEDAEAQDLVAEADRLRRPMIFFRDEAPGERLASGFAALGWRVDRHLVMVQRRPPERTPLPGLVRELDADALHPARRRLVEHYPWATPKVIESLYRAKGLIAERVDTRFLGILVGDEVVAYADLYLEPPAAQIEDVGTLEEHRGRGYASTLVLHATETARRAGADLVFLVADAEDWPQHLYRQLGFDAVGRYVKFIRPGI